MFAFPGPLRAASVAAEAERAAGHRAGKARPKLVTGSR